MEKDTKHLPAVNEIKGKKKKSKKKKVINEEVIRTTTLKDVVPNEDIPMSVELGISLNNKWALTPARLALLGILDDFYQMYLDVEREVESQGKEYNGRIHYFFLDETKKQVQKLCEPIMNKHSCVFSNKFEQIFIGKREIDNFTFFDSVKYGRATFSEFCKAIEKAYIDTFFYSADNSQIPDFTAAKLINDRIQILAYLKEKERLLPIESKNAQQDTDEPLYMIDALSSTICYKEKHPVEPKSYIASLADKSG